MDPGRKPFSEIETKMMGDLIIAESNANPGKVGYLTFHSYGYWLLYPWGYSATVPEPPFVHKLQRVCERIAKTVHKFFGGIYKVFIISNISLKLYLFYAFPVWKQCRASLSCCWR